MSFVRDLRVAAQSLLRTPGLAIAVVLTLSLGIGATAAIFSAVQAVVLRPIPVPQPERILAVSTIFRQGQANVSAGNYVDGIEPVASFSGDK